MSHFRCCPLCYRFPGNQRILPNCGHSFCLLCIVGYYDNLQRTSVMRIGSFPCPVLKCRVFSVVPPGGVVDFPSEESDIAKQEVDPEEPSLRSKKRVTFSDKEEDKNSTQERRSEEFPVPGVQKFKSIMKVSLGSIPTQQEVDIPDSAMVIDPEPVAPPEIWTGNDDLVINRKRLGESVFVFPSVVIDETEMKRNENDVNNNNENCDKSDNETETEIEIRDGPEPTEIEQVPGINNFGMKFESKQEEKEEEEKIKGETSPELDLLWRIEARDHHKPTSIILTEDDKGIVANYGLGNLELLDEIGSSTLTSDPLKPFSVIMANVSGFRSISSCVICADRRHKSLMFIHPEYGDVITQWEPGFFEWVGGLGVLRNGNFVVSDRVHCCVGVYTPDGARIMEFGSYGAGEDNICMADYLTVDSKDRIIVSDSANHCIKVFDSSGMFLSRISQRGNSDGQLSWPKGVCVSQMDNIIVADSKNERISMFSPNGEFIEHLISGVPYPYSVCCGPRGNTIATTHYSLSGYSRCDCYRLKTLI